MNDAVYVSSTNKIYGTNGPYVIQYNATTGAREGYVRVGSPIYGDMRITYHAANSTLYVSTWNQPSRQYFGTFFPTDDVPGREVFPVSTNLVVGAHIQLGTFATNLPPYGGFNWIGSSGNYLYVIYSSTEESGGLTLIRVNPTNIADRNSQSGASSGFQIEHCGLSSSNVIRPTEFTEGEILVGIILFNLNSHWSSLDVNPNRPVACAYSDTAGKFYLVCGDDNLVRLDALTPFAVPHTVLNLGAVEATADPCRIRYNSSNGLLYMPCMTSNSIIVWNTNTETGIAKTGFDNPVDVIFAGSKIWAVQNAMVGLKEVT